MDGRRRRKEERINEGAGGVLSCRRCRLVLGVGGVLSATANKHKPRNLLCL